MELKEVVNLRKLKEFFSSCDRDYCHETCPFRSFCNDLPHFPNCICDKMLNGNPDFCDLYDLEAEDVW